jgi:hypothetical protein
VTITGRDSFTVASGAASHSAAGTDSIKSRVVELLQKGAEADDQYKSAEADDALAPLCAAATKCGCASGSSEPNSQASGKQFSAARLLGWCMPVEAGVAFPSLYVKL